MTFEKFYEIMSTHGIGEISFFINEKYDNCWMGMTTVDFQLVYWIALSESENFKFDSLEEMVNYEIVHGSSIKDLWNIIRIYNIEGVSEDEYLPEQMSINFQEYIRDFGKLEWSYKPSKMQFLCYALKFIMVGPILFLLLGFILSITNDANWSILIFFVIINTISLLIAIPVILIKNKNIIYIITDKQVVKEMGLMFYQAPYTNIKRIKLKRAIFNKRNGSIKIYVKKGLSLNYHLDNIKNVDEAYAIISKHLKN